MRRTIFSLITFSLIVFTVFLLVQIDSASARRGGISLPGPTIKKARLVGKKLVAPSNAPSRVKGVIRAANRITNKPYVYGGGHGSFRSRGYDCSGAVSFALHGGRFLRKPLASPALMRWGKAGKGKWITVYANRGHAYMVVAGYRFDTSGTGGKGPRWHKTGARTRGFKVRSIRGF